MSALGRKRGAKRVAAANGAVRRPATLTIRPAGPSDAKPLNFFFDAVLRKDYFLRRGQLDDILTGTHHQAYVAELDAVLVGIAIVTAGKRLVNLLVHPAYRGLRIGKALLRTSGVTEVRAKIDTSSGDPRGFYEKAGFVRTARFNGKGNIEVMRKPAKVAARAKAKVCEA